MTDQLVNDVHSLARSVFAGLRPEVLHDSTPVGRPMNSTMPILLVGAMAVGLTAAPATEHASSRPTPQPATGSFGILASAVKAVKVSSQPAPGTYTVVAGDTVSGIAARFGLTTAGVLALNGLSRTSLIFPGQKLTLTTAVAPVPAVPIATAPASAVTKHTIARGDTISAIAKRYGVATTTVLAANGLGWNSVIYPGQVISIPSQPAPVAEAPAPVETPVETPSATPTTPVVDAPTTVVGYYVIQTGDSITRIGAKFGVSVQSILDANGLTRSSIIYAGRTLTIPGVVTPAATVTASTGTASTGTVTLLADDQLANAVTIVAVGRSLGVSDFGIIVALSAAMQESSLRNISYGHLDSVGLFQQRPSAGWGNVDQLTDPVYATRLFFGGATNPNRGKTRGLLDIAGWQSMTVTQAAQKVQVSAYPNAYAKWEASARFWLGEMH
jgi:LysM repeat protein